MKVARDIKIKAERQAKKAAKLAALGEKPAEKKAEEELAVNQSSEQSNPFEITKRGSTFVRNNPNLSRVSEPVEEE